MEGASRDPSRAITSWLAEARAGSNEALGKLFESCRSYLLLVANQELGADLQAKINPSDLVQETFLEAKQAFPRFEGASEAELMAWLRRILLNNLANVTRHYRGTRRRQLQRELGLNGNDVQEPIDLPAAAPSPSEQLLAREQAAALEAALARLPEHYRVVLQLRHQESRSFVEIGDALGRSADAARMLWARAVEQLREEMRNTHGSSS